MMTMLDRLLTINEFYGLSEGHEKAHNPFRHYPRLGDKSPHKRKGADETGSWECHRKGKYVQICHGVGTDNEGRQKIVKVHPGWKKNYNHQYKGGIASGAYTPAVRSGGEKRGAKKKKAS